MVWAVETLSKDASGKVGAKSVSQAGLGQHTKLPKSTISYRVKRLLSLGYLANLETGKGKPHKLVPGTTLPDEAKPLPSPCELSEYLFSINQTELIEPWTEPVKNKTHNCLEHVGQLDTSSGIPVTSGADRPTPHWTVCVPKTREKQTTVQLSKVFKRVLRMLKLELKTATTAEDWDTCARCT